MCEYRFIKNGGAIIFFLKRSFRNLKFTEDELNFTEKLTFGSDTTRKWSDYFKPKNEIPQQFELIGMELTKEKSQELKKILVSKSSEDMKNLIKENKKYIKKFALKDSPAGVDGDKNTRVEMKYKPHTQTSADGDQSKEYEYRLTRVETKYSEKNLPETYELKGLEIIQEINNDSLGFSKPYSQTEEKLTFGKIESTVESVELGLSFKWDDNIKSKKVESLGRPKRGDELWKILIESAP